MKEKHVVLYMPERGRKTVGNITRRRQREIAELCFVSWIKSGSGSGQTGVEQTGSIHVGRGGGVHVPCCMYERQVGMP